MHEQFQVHRTEGWEQLPALDYPSQDQEENLEVLLRITSLLPSEQLNNVASSACPKGSFFLLKCSFVSSVLCNMLKMLSTTKCCCGLANLLWRSINSSFWLAKCHMICPQIVSPNTHLPDPFIQSWFFKYIFHFLFSSLFIMLIKSAYLSPLRTSS